MSASCAMVLAFSEGTATTTLLTKESEVVVFVVVGTVGDVELFVVLLVVVGQSPTKGSVLEPRGDGEVLTEQSLLLLACRCCMSSLLLSICNAVLLLLSVCDGMLLLLRLL